VFWFFLSFFFSLSLYIYIYIFHYIIVVFAQTRPPPSGCTFLGFKTMKQGSHFVFVPYVTKGPQENEENEPRWLVSFHFVFLPYVTKGPHSPKNEVNLEYVGPHDKQGYANSMLIYCAVISTPLIGCGWRPRPTCSGHCSRKLGMVLACRRLGLHSKLFERRVM